jgi:hypothetical protein
MELRNALNEFREKETIKKFGLSRLKNSGPGLIMPDAVLKRIVDCAHMQKIGNKDDLQIKHVGVTLRHLQMTSWL